VPWCETCDRHYNPSAVAPDGTCVACGSFIADEGDPADEHTKPPWHFWLLVAALLAYLGWRVIQVVAFAITGEWS
jgi:hypothetical protein